MIVYYMMSYGNRPGESHRLLADAIADYLRNSDAAKSGSASGCKKAADEMVSRIKTRGQGKPYIEDFKEFSISHSENAWAVAISDAECGLDIQFERDARLDAISQRIYDPADAEAVRCAAEGSADGSDVRAVFFNIWVRREALAKAMGNSAFESSLPSVLGDAVRVSHDGTAREYTLRDLSIPYEGGRSGAVLHAAICTEGDSAKESIIYRELTDLSK